ncbi:hypothetical protein [Nostocoides vanveenii]|uniref:hypothetical protein n=1 Tax=Nostocoides vanveenii TaxID=330835 RepID=UPI0031D2C498
MSSSGGGVVGVLVGLGFGDVGEGVGVIDVGDGLVVDGFGVAVGVGVVDVLAVAGSVVLGLGVLVVFGEVLDAPGVVTADVVARARSPLGEHAVIPIVAASSTAAALTPRPLVISIPTDHSARPVGLTTQPTSEPGAGLSRAR